MFCVYPPDVAVRLLSLMRVSVRSARQDRSDSTALLQAGRANFEGFTNVAPSAVKVPRLETIVDLATPIASDGDVDVDVGSTVCGGGDGAPSAACAW